MDEYEEAVLFTFSLLESRLDRLEYVLGGAQDVAKDKPRTIADRIHRMEQSLQQLAGKTALLDEANNLLSKHKDVLKPPPTADDSSESGDSNSNGDSDSDRDSDYDDDEHEDKHKHKHKNRNRAWLSSGQKMALVVERATSFATTASQLQALEDQAIPTTEGFSKLAALRPRIAEAEERQLQQALKLSELRRRNGLMNQRYKQVMVLGAGRCWVDYNERLTKALREVVREEYRRRADDEQEGDEAQQGGSAAAAAATARQDEEEEATDEDSDDDEL